MRFEVEHVHYLFRVVNRNMSINSWGHSSNSFVTLVLAPIEIFGLLLPTYRRDCKPDLLGKELLARNVSMSKAHMSFFLNDV